MKDIISQLVTVMIAVGAAWYGGYMSRKASIEAAKWQMEETANEKKSAHLSHLLAEYEHNLEILKRIQDFLHQGPNIEHLWSPALVNASYLQVDAWNALIQDGVLSSLVKQERNTFEKANRAVLDAKRCIEEIGANWLRVREWAIYDQETNNPQPLMQPRLFLPGALNNSKERVEEAIRQLTMSKEALEQLQEN